MPISPIPETPPLKVARNAIDWRATLDALAGDPGEWFKVDGPIRGSAVQAREKSLAKFAETNGFEVEVTHRNVDGAHWIYPRHTPAKTKPAPEPAPKPAARLRQHRADVRAIGQRRRWLAALALVTRRTAA